MPRPKPPPKLPSGSKPPGRPKAIFDWYEWLRYIESYDASEDEICQQIDTVWTIILSFVDLGWEVGARSAFDANTSGQEFDLTAALRAAVVDSKEQQQEKEAL